MSAVLADVELPEVRATVEQRIGDGNGGPAVAYRLVIDGGRAHLEPVPADTEPARSEPGEHRDIAERASRGGGQGSGDAGQAGDSEALGIGDDGGPSLGIGDHGGPSLGIGDDGGVVVMSQSRETAEAVRRGELGALAALQAGLITVSGDVRVLIAASEALALVNTALGQALAAEGSNASDGGADCTDDRSDSGGIEGADGSAGGGGPDGPGDAGGTSEPDGRGGG